MNPRQPSRVYLVVLLAASLLRLEFCSDELPFFLKELKEDE